MTLLKINSPSEAVFKAIGTLVGIVLTDIYHAFLNCAVFIIIASVVIIWDCIEARKLAKRLEKKHGKEYVNSQFQSSKFGKVIFSFALSWGIIFLGSLLYPIMVKYGYPKIYTDFWSLILVLVWQGWSILENAANCNEKKRIPQLLRNLVVDKTSRHLNVDLSELKKDEYESANN